MYYYISHPQNNDKARKELDAKIKQQLSSKQIEGEHIEVSHGQGISQAVAQAAKNGAKTIVAIGNDNDLSAVVSAVASENTANIAVGFIPTYKHGSPITNLLGIHDWKDGIAILPARKLHDFSLLKAGKNHILASLTLRATNEPTPIKCVLDDKLTIEADGDELTITNLINQSQPNNKKIAVELTVQKQYQTKAKESLLHLPAITGRHSSAQTLFRLQADNLTVSFPDGSLENLISTSIASPLTINGDATMVRMIVKKHRGDQNS